MTRSMRIMLRAAVSTASSVGNVRPQWYAPCRAGRIGPVVLCALYFTLLVGSLLASSDSPQCQRVTFYQHGRSYLVSVCFFNTYQVPGT